MPIQVIAELEPKNSGEFPVVSDHHVKGGYRVLADHATRNATSLAMRQAGMQVRTLNDGKFWSLNGTYGSPANTGTDSDWTELPGGMVWQGLWSGLTPYVIRDAVSYQGSSYVCLVSNTGSIPGVSGDWLLIAAKGDQGAPGTNGTAGPAGAPGAIVEGIQTTLLDSYVSIGAIYFDPTVYVGNYYFEVILQTSTITNYTIARLWNATDASEVVVLNNSGVSDRSVPNRLLSGGLTLPGSARIYEVHLKMSLAQGDAAICKHAQIIVS